MQNFVVVSMILSSISSRSHSVKTIRSPCDLYDFFFFLVPHCCSLSHLFRINEVLYPSSPLSPFLESSSSSISSEGDLSHFCDSHCSYSSCSLATYSCSTWAFSMDSLFFFSLSVCTTFLATSFLFYAAELTTPLLVPTSKLRWHATVQAISLSPPVHKFLSQNMECHATSAMDPSVLECTLSGIQTWMPRRVKTT